MTIIIGFSRAKDPWKIGSRFIQEVEKREFSHVYMRYTCPITRVEMVCQASHGFVNETAYDIFQEHNIVVEEYAIDCDEHLFISILTFCKNNLGIPYSKFQLVLIGIKKIFHVELDIHNTTSAEICSEWGARICAMLGIKSNENLDYTTPSDLNKLLSESNAVLING